MPTKKVTKPKSYKDLIMASRSPSTSTKTVKSPYELFKVCQTLLNKEFIKIKFEMDAYNLVDFGLYSPTEAVILNKANKFIISELSENLEAEEDLLDSIYELVSNAGPEDADSLSMIQVVADLSIDKNNITHLINLECKTEAEVRVVRTVPVEVNIFSMNGTPCSELGRKLTVKLPRASEVKIKIRL